MSKTPKKDHIDQAVLEARKQIPDIAGAVADRIQEILNERAGMDLKKSEAQAIARDLVELQTGQTDNQYEKQD